MSENKLKILITGATGSIGKHLVKALAEQGHHCRCLVREASKLDFLKEQGVELFHGDLLLPETLKGIVEGIDVVFHLAAEGHISSTSEEAYERAFKVNVEGTRNLLKECVNSGIKRFVHFSSTAAMGLIENKLVDENTPCSPKTPYQITKYESEQVVMDYFKKDGVPVVILRPCMVYGDNCKGEYLRIFSFMKKGIFPKLGTGQKLTPLVYIHNLIPAVANAATMGQNGNIYLLVDSSVEIDILHKKVCESFGIKAPYIFLPPFIAFALMNLYEMICRVLGKDPKLSLKNVKSTVANRIFDSTKARRDLNFRRIVGFDESLKATIAWAKAKKYL